MSGMRRQCGHSCDQQIGDGILRPDLAKVHARTVEFSCELAPAPEQLERLRATFADGSEYKDFPWFFLNRYRASHKLHTTWAIVTGPDRAGNRLRLDFRFWVGVRIRGEFEAKPVADLVRALSEWEMETTFDCSVSLLYPEEEWVSRISLPMRLFQYTELPFDEFRGLRAAKVEDGRTVYSIIIDRPENKALSHVVVFSHSAAISDRLGDVILAQGAHISSLFVRRHEG